LDTAVNFITTKPVIYRRSSTEAFCISEIGFRSLARKLVRRMDAARYKLSDVLLQSISRRRFDTGKKKCLYSNKGIA